MDRQTGRQTSAGKKNCRSPIFFPGDPRNFEKMKKWKIKSCYNIGFHHFQFFSIFCWTQKWKIKSCYHMGFHHFSIFGPPPKDAKKLETHEISRESWAFFSHFFLKKNWEKFLKKCKIPNVGLILFFIFVWGACALLD